MLRALSLSLSFAFSLFQFSYHWEETMNPDRIFLFAIDFTSTMQKYTLRENAECAISTTTRLCAEKRSDRESFIWLFKLWKFNVSVFLEYYATFRISSINRPRSACICCQRKKRTLRSAYLACEASRRESYRRCIPRRLSHVFYCKPWETVYNDLFVCLCYS